MRLIKKVQDTIFKYGMLEEGDSVIVALSGGVDSVVLLDVLHELKGKFQLSLTVAHVNHGLRPKEAEAEAKFAEKIASHYHLPFFMKTLDIPSLLKGNARDSKQTLARQLRYEFLWDLAQRQNATKIALGHNLDDQAETLLIRLLRGTGLKGLSSIPPVRQGMIIRPLIEATREEILEYANSKKLAFVEDSSNQLPIYLRNRVRLELMPFLEEFNPNIKKILASLADMLRDYSLYLEGLASSLLEKALIKKDDDALSLHIQTLKEGNKVIICEAIRKAIEILPGPIKNIQRSHIYSIYDMLEKNRANSKVHLPDGWIVRRDYNTVTISIKKEEYKGFNYTLSIPGEVFLQEIQKRIKASVLPIEKVAYVVERGASEAYFDAGKVKKPLLIRNPRPGDRIHPLGMQGSKKVKDIFIDGKVPIQERKMVPIVISNGEPIWVVGFRMDERFKIDERTKEVLKLEICSCKK